MAYAWSSLNHLLLGSTASSFRHYLAATPHPLSIAPNALVGVLIPFKSYMYCHHHAFKPRMSPEVRLIYIEDWNLWLSITDIKDTNPGENKWT